MDDTATEFKCFPRSPNQTNKSARNSSPCWFFTSNRKMKVVSPQADQANFQVSNKVQTVSKEEHERVLQERNSLNDQLYQKKEEINKLKNQVGQLTGELDRLDDHVLQERISLNNQLYQKNEEINKLKNQVGLLKGELDWLLSYSNSAFYLSRAQDEAGSSLNNKEQLSVTTAESNVVNRDQNKEKAIQEDKTQPLQRVRVERDIIGARASPLPPLYPPMQSGRTLPKPPGSTKELLDSYTYIFDKIMKEKQLIKGKEGGPEAARAEPIALARLPSDLSYTDIFHTLVAEGLITPQSPETDESGLYSHTSYLQICAYHNGGRGHSTENCSQLRLQVLKLIRDGVIKVEPPHNLVVFQNKSSVPNFGN